MKTVDCRFTENNYFLGSYEKKKAICLETDDVELVKRIKSLLHSDLSFAAQKKNADYKELENLCKILKNLDEAIELFESFEEKEQMEKETEEEERKECAGTISDID